LLDVLVLVAALYQADREQRPVRPRQALTPCCRTAHYRTRWPQMGKPNALAPGLRHLPTLAFVVARAVGDVRADGHMIDTHLADKVVDVVQEGGNVALAAEERCDAADASVSPRGGQGLENVIRFATDVLV